MPQHWSCKAVLTTVLTEYLEREGFDITAVHNGDAAVREALNGDYALVVLDVMVARIRAILRRTSNDTTTTNHEPLQTGALTLYPEKRQTLWHGQALEFTSTEFNLLEVLARQAGQPVSKADLSTHGLGRPLTRYDRSIDVHMSSIRHKLGNLPDGRSCIQTVRGIGYQLIGE